MDPDEALRICLDESREPTERRDAATGLARWLRMGGFPPSESLVNEAGVTRRRRLAPPRPRCRLYLEKYRGNWAIVWTGTDTDPVVRVWLLRKEF